MVLIAGAGGAAHLPGMTAAHTPLPVLGVPVESRALKGLDSLLSIVQMPAGVPVGTLAIGKAGAVNAALLAASIVGLKYPEVMERLKAYRQAQTEAVLAHPDPREGHDRRPGRGAAGADAGPCGLPLGAFLPLPGPFPRGLRRAGGGAGGGGFSDEEALSRFAQGLSLATYEFENVPVEVVHLLAEKLPVYPPPKALEVAQDRLKEKRFFQGLGVPTPPFHPVDGPKDLEEGLKRVGLPALLKTRRGGYDGKGQVLVRTEGEAREALLALGGKGVILEGFVPFDREVSLLAVRGRGGEVAFYPWWRITTGEGSSGSPWPRPPGPPRPCRGRRRPTP